MIARRYVIASAVALLAAAGLGYGVAQLVDGRPKAPEAETAEHETHGETDL